MGIIWVSKCLERKCNPISVGFTKIKYNTQCSANFLCIKKNNSQVRFVFSTRYIFHALDNYAGGNHP